MQSEYELNDYRESLQNFRYYIKAEKVGREDIDFSSRFGKQTMRNIVQSADDILLIKKE